MSWDEVRSAGFLVLWVVLYALAWRTARSGEGPRRLAVALGVAGVLFLAGAGACVLASSEWKTS